MKISILGGGPAGLYFALLMKKQDPAHEVVVVERNPRGNTFGWGVVFSDRTLSYLSDPDPPSYEQIVQRMETWENVDIVHKGVKIGIAGNRFSGIARIELLDLLQKRCEELGVELRFGAEVHDLDELPAADLVVAADGVNSVVRRNRADVFGPDLDRRPNKYAWYGTPRLFHGLTLTFRTNEHGLFIAHSYKFSQELSTFIVECDPQSWDSAGLGEKSDAESRAYLEEVFADDLEGEKLLSNKSEWIQFVTVRNRTWIDGNVVLLGDAAHTAHFSIGSGTKLALEDAAALSRSFAEHGSVEAALAAYEAARKPDVERLQDAAQASLEWFENAGELMHLEPLPFAFNAMTRSSRVGIESLRRRDPDFVAKVEEEGA